MSEVTQVPKIRCDNCGTIADKKHMLGSWRRPNDWGDVRVAPLNSGVSYPNQIAMTDLCPRCLGLVHEAVGNALEAGRAALQEDGR